MGRLLDFLFLLLVARYIVGICDDSWLSRGLHCYFISKEKVTFQDADELCQQSNAHLIELEDRAENDFVFSMTMKTAEESYWIGYKKIIKDLWRWTGSGYVGLYFNWGIGEPDSEGDCARITPFSGGVWRDMPCDLPLRYVCKKLANCGKPIELQNAQISFSSGPMSSSGGLFYPAQSKAAYTCVENFEFTDKTLVKTSVCELGGVWKPVVPDSERCDPKLCPKPPTFTHVESNATSKNFFDIGSVIAYTCQYAYWFSAFEATVKYKYLTCQPDQTWAGDNVGDCSRMYCIRPITSNSGANSSSNTFGTVVSYRCKKGYQFKDKSTFKVFTCGTQTWIPPPERCLIKKCSAHSVANASASTLSVNYGTRVTWTCHAGLQYPDTTTRKAMYCVETEKWIPLITMKCEPKLCRKAPPNATKLYTHNWNASKSYKYLDELDYECVHEGWTFPSHNPQRIRKVMCGPNAEWTPQTVGECTGEKIIVHTQHSTKAPKESKGAEVVGYIGWLVVGGILLCIVLLDVTTIGKHLTMMRNNICPPKEDKQHFITNKVQKWKKVAKRKTVSRQKPDNTEEFQKETRPRVSLINQNQASHNHNVPITIAESNLK